MVQVYPKNEKEPEKTLYWKNKVKVTCENLKTVFLHERKDDKTGNKA